MEKYLDSRSRHPEGVWVDISFISSLPEINMLSNELQEVLSHLHGNSGGVHEYDKPTASCHSRILRLVSPEHKCLSVVSHDFNLLSLGQNMSWFYLLLVNICHGFAFSYDFTFYLLLVKIPEDPAVACHTYLVCRESYTIGVPQVLK